jgi:FeS assembly SUF system protein
MFSFLSGKSGEAAPPEAEHPDQAGTAAGTPAPQMPGATDAGAETPFAPPSAWDMDTAALTAPAPSTSAHQPQVGPADAVKTAALQGPIIEVIKTVYDPEIPVDIYELGLIYEIIVDADDKALVRMTLTSPACPSAQQIPSEVRYKVKAVEGISDAAVEVVWEPPWDKDRMSEAARLSLGFF